MTIKTPITYWGGKQLLSPLICSIIPEHTTYCEPFFGGGAVFFHKPKSKVEIINDLNGEVVNFYRQCASNFEALQARIRETPYSRALHKDAYIIYSNPHLFPPVERAWAFWVLTNQGYCGKIGTSWGYGTAGNSCEKKVNNRRILFNEDLKNRLDMVQIECTDAIRLITLRDREETFFYLDPPYFNSNLGHYGGYTEQHFEDLLKLCSKLKGKFILSSYPSEILTRYTKENAWSQHSLDQATLASKDRKTKTEVITANFPLIM